MADRAVTESPLVAQLELTIRIRDRRREIGMSAAAASKALEFSPNYLSAVENDRSLLAEVKLVQLAELYEFPTSEVEELIKLLAIAKKPRWWNHYSGIADDEMLRYFGLEDGAETISSYESNVVTGMLQNEEYARAVIGADPAVSAVTEAQRLELRKRRQRRLRNGDPLRLSVLMSEAVLWQHFGPREVLLGQLKDLSSAIDDLDGQLTVQILPFENSPMGMTGASTLHLLEFASSYLPTLIWRDAITPIGATTDPDEVETLRVSYLEARSKSGLSPEESHELISERVRQLERR